jgi:dolichyl-phosphate-mannose--protein O-mannosyl transferase
MYKPVWFYSSKTINSMRGTIVDIGNPFIWWFGTISSIYLLINSIKKKDSNNIFILTFILSTFLPYIFIGRIMFMYHYFITLPFVMLGIVSFTKYITEKIKNNKFYISYIIVIIITFIIFYPISSGMEIDESYINSLKWLSSWIF